MVQMDPRKIENKDVRHDIASHIVSIRNGSHSKETKRVMIVALLAEKKQTETFKGVSCPYEEFPDGEVKERFMTVWNSLKTDGERRQMKDNIAISNDGKLNIISMKKKFALLTAEHNGEDVFAGTHTDRGDDQGVPGVTYFTGKAAERVCEEQGKKLFNTKEEAQAFMSYFPGEDEEARVRNFVAIIGLQKAGYWDLDYEEWDYVGSNGYVTLSKVNDDGDVYEAYWNGVIALTGWNDQEYPSPVIAFEDC